MPSNIREISVQDCIDQMVKRIVAEVDPDTVILFGSQAKGTAGPDSDVDLLVIEREPFTRERSRRQELAKLNMAIFDFDISTDILLYSRSEIDEGKIVNSVLEQAYREGKVLYARH